MKGAVFVFLFAAACVCQEEGQPRTNQELYEKMTPEQQEAHQRAVRPESENSKELLRLLTNNAMARFNDLKQQEQYVKHAGSKLLEASQDEVKRIVATRIHDELHFEDRIGQGKIPETLHALSAWVVDNYKIRRSLPADENAAVYVMGAWLAVHGSEFNHLAGLMEDEDEESSS
eukprot:Rhum_TRINITY_DN20900_c0_g1::Rhum_TRINITY_DN20900_c0_g1_i1::g.172549::m.172549